MATLTGSNGTFVTTVTTGTTYAPIGVKNRDKIKIDYTPNPGTCTDIRLVQTVQWVAYDATGAVVGRRPEDIYRPGHNAHSHRNDDEITVGTSIWAVDHRSCEGDPFYNGNDPMDKTSSADATATPPGTTTMTDSPNSTIWAGNVFNANVDSIVKTFEVCAICVTTGVVLDCITWSSKSTKSPKDGGTITEPTTTGTQSAAHKKALKEFCKGHVTKLGNTKHWSCPDKVPNPIRGSLSGPFGNLWATIVDEKGFFHATPDGEYVGTGHFSQNHDEVFASIFRTPETSAVKITWSGDEDKTIPTIVYSPLREISNQMLGSFIPNEDPRFLNDFLSLFSVQVDLTFFLPFLASIASKRTSLLDSDGAVTITTIANVGTTESTAFIGSLSPSEFQEILNNFLPISTLTANTRETLKFLALNMGVSEFVSDCAPYYKNIEYMSQRYFQNDNIMFTNISGRIKTLTWIVIGLSIMNTIAIMFLLAN